MSKSDLRRLEREARRKGWTEKPTKDGTVWMAPDGETVWRGHFDNHSAEPYPHILRAFRRLVERDTP